MPRKTKWVGVKWASKRPAQRRIRIPQPAFRPIHVTSTKPRIKETRPSSITIHRRGPQRDKIGPDNWLEYHAEQGIRGTLPERIVYKALKRHGYRPGIDFDFQSSLLGGRLSLGGIVADFIFPYKRIVVQVQGPTHSTFIRKAKDSEQRELLEQMGYTSLEIPQETVFNRMALDRWIRQNIDITAFASVSSIDTVSSFRKFTDEETE